MWGMYYGKLRAARIRAGLSQTDLARKAGMTPSYISKLENDPFIKTAPETQQKLADALECSVKDVWDSPYEILDEKTGKGLARAERAILRAFLKLGQKNRIRIVEVQRRLNEYEEQENANTQLPTKKRNPNP